jgi:hypothetical protein
MNGALDTRYAPIDVRTNAISTTVAMNAVTESDQRMSQA